MILEGDNLGERQRHLNSKVSDAVVRKANFEEVKGQDEECDVDKLFKIDLASKYKNIDYILEVLKCGDTLHISRALKCLWMYTDEYSQFINTDYLETNIFPHMSIKMKRKMLTAISMHMRNADRAIHFYKYCIDARLNDYAVKFLMFTSDAFKLDFIKTNKIKSVRELKLLKQFIGGSFELALAYVRLHDYSSSIIQELRFLYSVSQNEYLNILENIRINPTYPQCSRQLGIRISKNIITKHKQRVLNNPLLYVNILNKGILVKHLTTGDVETLAPKLLPEYSREYWYLNFYNTYKFVLQKIPANKIYSYMKQIYVSKYDGAEFEMNIEFYRLKYYEMLNIDEREAWALRHIERDEEFFGIKKYTWYQFVSLQKAFSAIKRYIFLTPDQDERSRIVNILPETARNPQDEYEILNYYYIRHVNESEKHKESFINKLIEVQDIFAFNNECWTTFDKLLYSLDVYTTPPNKKSEYKLISLIYHILNEQDMTEPLQEFSEQLSYFYHFETLLQKLTEGQKAIVAKYFINYCAERIAPLMSHPDYNTETDDYWNSIKYKIQRLVDKVWNTINFFKRPHEECPAIVVQFMESNMDIYQYHEKYKEKFEEYNERDFIRWLKYDNEVAVNGISEIRSNTYRWNFRLCNLFRKLKVYFPNDVAKEYLDYFMDYLSDIPEGRREYRNIKMAVVGLFYLGDPDTIISFLEKHVPTSPKIDRKNLDNRVFQVQKAICRLAYHPRPPLSLSIIKKYITGDYVHYCLPTIYNYFANLQSSTTFIDSLLDAPLSIQKHGLRLAFRSYDAETLSPIIVSAWKKTKNVSLRMILYEMLFNRILKEDHEVQEKLYEVLKLYTSELNHDDHDNVYSLLVYNDFPNAFKGDFIETSWITVSKLPEKSDDVRRRISIIRHMEHNIHLVRRDFPRQQIIYDHIKDILGEKNIDRYDESYIKDLVNAKWNLTAKYIVSFNNEVEQQQSLELMQIIMRESLQNWNLVRNETYVVRKFIDQFINIITDKDPKTIESCSKTVPIYQCILDNLRSSVSKEKMYLLNWKLQLTIIGRNIIHNGRKADGGTDTDKPKYMTDKEIIHAYGKAVAEMVESSVKNNEFFRCFFDSIANIVNNVGFSICGILNTNSNGFVYYVSESLIKSKLPETHLLSLFILPKNPNYNWEREHSDIITEIKNQSVSQEVKSFLYNKYVMSDYAYRSYIE